MKERSELLDCTTDNSILQAVRKRVQGVVGDRTTSIKRGRSRYGEGAGSQGHSGKDSGEVHLS